MMFNGFFEEPVFLLGRIILAGFLGGLIGLERDIHGRAAGVRTNLLVGMGAAVFMIMSEMVASPGPNLKGSEMMSGDPGRIAAQIVTGIGFLGAGTIIKAGITIRGLTTAACLWVVAGIGMASGAGYYSIAIVTTFVSICSLQGLLYLEKLYPKDTFGTLMITTTNEADPSIIRSTIKSMKDMSMKMISFNLKREYDTGITTATASIRFSRKDYSEDLADVVIRSFENTKIPLKSIRWELQ